jgi:tRNA dimethylallyltransferase
VPHHFIDIIFPNENYSAGRYGREARVVIDSLFAQHKMPIVAGGSGFYIRALVDGFFDQQISDSKIKLKLKHEIFQQGVLALYERLKLIDLPTAQKVHPNDGHRIVRALEVYEITGQPLSEFQKERPISANFSPLFIGLNRERNRLYRLIEDRVEAMIKNGLVDEALALKKMGFSPALNSLQTVGYKEAFEYLNNKIAFHEMINFIKLRSRNYAKRQLTWFRNDDRIKWFDVDAFDASSDVLVNKLVEQLFSEQGK